MGNYKICVYAICKNEEAFVDRWMDAVSEADLVVVTDTGSTDGTVERLKARGAVVYTETIQPWRFDTARNVAMDHIPEDVDICVSNDLDEIFEPGWRAKLEKAWKPHHTRAKYLFTWSYFSDGSPNKQFHMEKIHRRHGFRWVHPVHEVLEYSGTDPDETVWIDMVLNHYPDLNKSRGQYLPLLELSAQENPQDDRTVFWLGREYVYSGKYDEAIQTLKGHLALPSATWNEERSASLRLIAECYKKKGQLMEAKSWYLRAIAECPNTREPYHHMAQLCYLLKDWPMTYAMVSSALGIQLRTGSYLMEPESWDYHLYDLGAISCYYLGLYEKSEEFALEACKLAPKDIRLQKNLELVQAKLADKG